MIILPKLYAIVDASRFPDTHALCAFTDELAAGGVTFLQYRNKSGNAREMLEQSRELKRHLPKSVQLIMNDRADLCLAAGFDGIHLGQEDLSPESARKVIGDSPALGVSTHNCEQVKIANKSSADYLAIGPVFATSAKLNPDPVIGLDGVRAARALTRKPLVAIGGITRAVISDLLLGPCKSAEEFFSILR